MVRVSSGRSARRALIALFLCALASLGLALVAGLMAARLYLPGSSVPGVLTMQHLRPLHTTFAIAWIYLAALVVLHLALFQRQAVTGAVFGRLKLQLAFWGLAGLGHLISLPMGIFSGREYLEGHPALSLLILAGWILFAINYFSVTGTTLTGRPLPHVMWTSAILLFLVVFLEAHAWLLPAVWCDPVRDITLQWKSYGTLVGTFNLLVYGALAFVREELEGCPGRRTPWPFFLFYVGLLNTLTNFSHHTYHVPQSHGIKWFSFVVSMLELIILFKVLHDLVEESGAKPDDDAVRRTVRRVLASATAWTAAMLALALLLSVPPINSLLHGTQVVMAHAMGSMLGIDTWILLACLTFVTSKLLARESAERGARWLGRLLPWLDASLALLILALLAKGSTAAYLEYWGPLAAAVPHVEQAFPAIFVLTGGALVLGLLAVSATWARGLVAEAYQLSK